MESFKAFRAENPFSGPDKADAPKGYSRIRRNLWFLDELVIGGANILMLKGDKSDLDQVKAA